MTVRIAAVVCGVVRHSRVVDIEDIPEGEDVAGEALIVRWVTDPAGRLCQVSAEIPELPSSFFESENGDGLVERALAWGANRLLQSRIRSAELHRSGPPIWYLEVCLSNQDRTLLAEEEAEGRDQASRRVDELVDQVAAGTLGAD
jgi:hypothetical protein